MQDLDCDFYVLSSHKMFGPTGTGVLYGRKPLLEAMPPYQGGGDMIASVTFEKTLYNQMPYKFEAGTPNIAGVAGFGAAIDYLVDDRSRRPRSRTKTTCSPTRPTRVREIPGARIIGEARHKTGVLSFLIEGVHPHDAGTILDQQGIAVRTGQHCAQPVMDKFCIPATIRASLGIYNTREDIDALVADCTRCARSFGLADSGLPPDPTLVLRTMMSELTDLYQEVILDHNRRPHNFRVDRRAVGEAGRLQPALRRSADAVSHARRRRDQGRGVPGIGLRDLEGVGVADDRRAQGQDGRRSARRCSSNSTR